MSWDDEEAVAAMLARMPDKQAAAKNRERLAASVNATGYEAMREKNLLTVDAPAVYDPAWGHEQEPAKADKPSQNRRGASETGKTKRRTARPEAHLCRQIKRALEDAGYRVYRVGEGRSDLAGQSAGIPDFLVTKTGWIQIVGIEVKMPDGVVSPAQAIGALEGHIHICQSPEEALAVMQAVERRTERC